MIQSNFEKICEFQEAAGSKRPSSLTIPNPEQLSLRLKLIQEEFTETMSAAQSLEPGTDPLTNLANFAHEMADLLYVVYGTFAVCGVDADAVFAEVHRANMAKMGGPRRADGKLLKPPGWRPADVTAVLKKLERKE